MKKAAKTSGKTVGKAGKDDAAKNFGKTDGEAGEDAHGDDHEDDAFVSLKIKLLKHGKLEYLLKDKQIKKPKLVKIMNLLRIKPLVKPKQVKWMSQHRSQSSP